MVPIASVLFPSLYMEIPTNSIRPPSVKEKRSNRRQASLRERIRWFYEAPVVHFYYHYVSRSRVNLSRSSNARLQIFFVSFLALFSYVLLVDYFPVNIYGEERSGIRNLPIPITEIVLHVCVASLIVDEIFQVSLSVSRKGATHDCRSV